MAKLTTVTAVLEHIAQQITDKISNPNYGGCAVIANIVGHHLKLLTGVEVDVLVRDSWLDKGPDNLIGHIRANNDTSSFVDARDWQEEGVNFGHVLLLVNIDGEQMVYDTEGLREYDPEEFYHDYLTLEECNVIASSPRGWNDEFNRKQIPKIVDIVEKAFARFNKWRVNSNFNFKIAA